MATKTGRSDTQLAMWELLLFNHAANCLTEPFPPRRAFGDDVVERTRFMPQSERSSLNPLGDAFACATGQREFQIVTAERG